MESDVSAAVHSVVLSNSLFSPNANILLTPHSKYPYSLSYLKLKQKPILDDACRVTTRHVKAAILTFAFTEVME